MTGKLFKGQKIFRVFKLCALLLQKTAKANKNHNFSGRTEA
jgi:hypothetical protein